MQRLDKPTDRRDLFRRYLPDAPSDRMEKAGLASELNSTYKVSCHRNSFPLQDCERKEERLIECERTIKCNRKGNISIT